MVRIMKRENAFVITLLILGVLVIGMFHYIETKQNAPFPERNFKGEFAMGLIPNAYPREPFADDKIIGSVKNGEEVYGFFQSTHLETKDLGKVFVWRIK